MGNLCKKIVLCFVFISFFFCLIHGSRSLKSNDSEGSEPAAMKLSAMTRRGGVGAHGIGNGGRSPTITSWYYYHGAHGHHSAANRSSDSSLSTMVLVYKALGAALLLLHLRV